MKLTPPAPQHPLRRLKFFKEHTLWINSEWEIKKIEQKYPKLVLGKPKKERDIVGKREVYIPKKRKTLWQKLKGMVGFDRT